MVVTKDSDFYHAHLLHGQPWKQRLIRTGNIRNRDLKALLLKHLPAIVEALAHHSLVELHRESVPIIA